MRTTWKPFSSKTKLTFLISLTFLFLFSGSVYVDESHTYIFGIALFLSGCVANYHIVLIEAKE